MTDATAEFPPIEEVLPHRGAMLLLDRLVAFDAQSADAEYAPRADAWYADAEGSMPAWVGVELMAQAAAAHVGMTRRSAGEPPPMGALLGTRRFVSTRPAFAAGEVLRVRSVLSFRDASGLGAYDCSIAVGGEEVATATLKVFEPADFQAFLQASRS
ncbi:MAG: beta-hydroxyacyl-ACP dehydratase [Ignavibacteria bacterium]